MNPCRQGVTIVALMLISSCATDKESLGHSMANAVNARALLQLAAFDEIIGNCTRENRASLQKRLDKMPVVEGRQMLSSPLTDDFLEICVSKSLAAQSDESDSICAINRAAITRARYAAVEHLNGSPNALTKQVTIEFARVCKTRELLSPYVSPDANALSTHCREAQSVLSAATAINRVRRGQSDASEKNAAETCVQATTYQEAIDRCAHTAVRDESRRASLVGAPNDVGEMSEGESLFCLIAGR